MFLIETAQTQRWWNLWHGGLQGLSFLRRQQGDGGPIILIVCQQLEEGPLLMAPAIPADDNERKTPAD